MRLTERTDIAVRILMHLAILKGQKISIDDLVDNYIGHRSQVIAAVQELRKAGMIASSTGRKGGGSGFRKIPKTFHFMKSFKCSKLTSIS
ncbi:Rrf2 family transcriptional regulator [Roseibium sp.]|uniref:Rrf2 family transcriptional regulator n=1 Tax=Roseibium sp. TaxID=1936156 RepID=UPI003B518CE5